jgi:NAD+ kinase
VYNKILFVPKVGGANVNEAFDYIAHAKKCLADYQQDSKYANSKVNRLTIIESYQEVDEQTVLVPVGGDGTVLHAAKAALEFNLPIIGFNLGRVGFLTDLTASYHSVMHLFFALVGEAQLYADNPDIFKEDHRTLLSVEFNGFEYVAMNDFVISDLYADSIINYDLKVGNSEAGTHKANSVIVATPTGSTAYALMVGGSIIEPDLDVIEVIPVAPLTMASRPIIMSGKSGVTITVHNKKGREVSCKADGQEVVRLRGDDTTITIKRHDRKVRLLHLQDWNYFEKLSLKLGWNK